MRIIGIMLVGLLLTWGHIVAAQSAGEQNVEVSGTWDNTGEGPRPTTIDVAVPRSADGMNLFKLQTSAHLLTNYADYRSADGMVVGSIYIYRPAIADTSYAMLMTSTVIARKFEGASVESDQLISVAGVQALHRRGFFVGTDKDGNPVTSIVGAMRVGAWIVKLRVTGRKDRSDKAFDALARGLTFGSGLKPAINEIENVSICLEGLRSPDPVADTRADADPLKLSLAKAVNPSFVTRPRKLCFMAIGEEGGVLSVVLSEEGLGRPTVMLMNDSGDGIMVVPALSGVHGWGMIIAIGDKATMFGPYDRAPGAAQMLALPSGEGDAWSGQAIDGISISGQDIAEGER